MTLYLAFINKGWFNAHATITWEDEGSVQQSQSSETLSSGTDFTVALPDEVRNVQLHVEHDTGLIWKPRNTTGDIAWSHPAAEFKNKRATVESFGSTLMNYGLTWTDHP